MLIATWNVNSIRQRLEGVSQWLQERQPHVVCLQEIKCMTEVFPASHFEDLGYNVAVCGQKTFNGVAILSKTPMEIVETLLPGDDTDEQARYLEVLVPINNSVVRVASLYLPNGNPLGTDKFAYKLRWMQRLHAHAERLLSYEEALVLAGDYNVIPEPEDAQNPEAWTQHALFQPESRAAFRALKNLGFSDAVRSCTDAGGLYTFWDYQAGAWARNAGIRIDHALLSPQAANHLRGVEIDKHVRGWEKPSDHVPLVIELTL